MRAVDAPDTEAALERCRSLLGAARVAPWDAPPHGGTTGARRRLAGVLRPRSVTEIQAILAIATATRCPLHPVSTGRNWGYGDALPAGDGGLLLDLSDMTAILDVDRELGLVTLEPGVTQGQLRDHLDAAGVDLMVPVTGAGPDCSLVGNALERGFGVTPLTDHFGAVTALEAVLPDGSLYRSAIAEAGARAADRAFKWGVGPYVDGLFAQGGFGIVTRMTLALAPRPARLTAFAFPIADETGLGAAVESVRALLRRPGLTLGGINLMNAPRVLAMLEPYPADGPDRLSDDAIARGRARHGLGAWTGIGAIYADDAASEAAARAGVRRALAAIGARPQFFGAATVARLARLSAALPAALLPGLRARLARAATLMHVYRGTPTTVALALPYWRAGVAPPPRDRAPDPARDGCGLIWYAPVVPATAEAARRFVALATRVTAAHGFNPLITLTSLSAQALDATVPIVYRQPDEAARARACHAALVEAGRAEGFLPYRLAIDAMAAETGRPGSVFWPTVARLKAALDPHGILAPGRYAPPPAG